MTTYIKLSTNEYPRHAGDIAIDPTGEYAIVHWVDQPAFDSATQRCNEGAPELIDGQWRMTWTVRDATQSEIARASTPIPNDNKRYSWSNEQLAWVEF